MTNKHIARRLRRIRIIATVFVVSCAILSSIFVFISIGLSLPVLQLIPFAVSVLIIGLDSISQSSPSTTISISGCAILVSALCAFGYGELAFSKNLSSTSAIAYFFIPCSAILIFWPIGFIIGAIIAKRLTAGWIVKSDHPICEKCGYNLTGNTSGRCPECGMQIKANRTIASDS